MIVPGRGRRRERLGVGAALAALALACAWAGGALFWALLAVAAALALREWLALHPAGAWRWAGLLYVVLPALALAWLRARPAGLEWVVFAFAIVWAADVGAFATGRLLGGARLWPAVSPGKTWAGFWGGNVAATLAGAVVGVRIGLSPGRAALAGLLLGLLAQGGDLFESWRKRRAGVKDSGRLLPGHGGVLDRLDSIAPVAPAVAGGVALGWL